MAPKQGKHKSPASKARSRQRLGRRERAQKAAEATAQPKVKPENETLKRKPPPPPAGKRTGVKKEGKGELGEVHPPQQAEAVAAVGDFGPPAKATKGKRKRAEKSSGHRHPPRLPPVPRRSQVSARRRKGWMMMSRWKPAQGEESCSGKARGASFRPWRRMLGSCWPQATWRSTGVRCCLQRTS